MRTCVLWSGGKDCFAALLLATGGAVLDPRRLLLATVAPPAAAFRCHPIAIMRRQARALGLEHVVLTIDPAAWQQEYRRVFTTLAATHGVRRIVTGDRILHPWLALAAADCRLSLGAPVAALRHHAEVFELLAAHGATATVSGMRADCYRSALLGRSVDAAVLQRLDLTPERGVDSGGEAGEYHTIVTRVGGRALLETDLSALPHQLQDGVWSLRLPPALAACG